MVSLEDGQQGTSVVARRIRGRGSSLAAPPGRRHAWAGQDHLFLGFPASPHRAPWSTISAEDQQRLAVDAHAGTTTPSGSWALLARDEDSLVLRSDRYGTRPLFYRAERGEVTVAESIWPLVQSPGRLDPVGVADFLLTGHGLGSRTIFQGVRSTRPDEILRFEDAGRSRTLLRPDPIVPKRTSLREAACALQAGFHHLFDPYSDLERMLIPLSGGLDSRTLLASAVDRGLDVHAWTFVLLEGSREEKIARAVAAALGVPHSVVHARAADLAQVAPEFVRAGSGQLSLEHVHAYGTHRLVPPDYEVSAAGAWGDIVCGGSRMPPEGLPTDRVVSHYIDQMLGGRDLSRLATRLPGVSRWNERLRELAESWHADVGADPARSELLLTRNRIARFNVWGAIVTRDTVDYVLPFVDEDLIRLCFELDPRWRRTWSAYRTAIRDRWPDLARIPWQKTGMRLSRYPGPWTRRRRALAARVVSPGSTAFTDLSVYQSGLADLCDEAEQELLPLLADCGIDIAGLLADAPELAGKLRLRLATLHLAIHEAGAEAAARVPTRR